MILFIFLSVENNYCERCCRNIRGRHQQTFKCMKAVSTPLGRFLKHCRICHCRVSETVLVRLEETTGIATDVCWLLFGYLTFEREPFGKLIQFNTTSFIQYLNLDEYFRQYLIKWLNVSTICLFLVNISSLYRVVVFKEKVVVQISSWSQIVENLVY